MKLFGDGGTPNELSIPGVEKSSISSLNMMPVLLPLTLAPKLGKHYSMHDSHSNIVVSVVYGPSINTHNIPTSFKPIRRLDHNNIGECMQMSLLTSLDVGLSQPINGPHRHRHDNISIYSVQYLLFEVYVSGSHDYRNQNCLGDGSLYGLPFLKYQTIL